MSTVTKVTAYMQGTKQVIDQPGFYARLRGLLSDFEVEGGVIISIEESEEDK